jgi:uncharacterized membrane protein YesL
VAATAAIFRAWFLEGGETWSVRRIWGTFHTTWKQELGSANAFGWAQVAIGVFLVWDYYLVNWNDMGVVGIGISGFLLVVNVLFVVGALESWVIRSHFDEGPRWIVRAAVRMALARPMCALAHVVLILLAVWAWTSWPGLLVTFGLAAPIFVSVMLVFFQGRLPGFGPQAAADAHEAVARAAIERDRTSREGSAWEPSPRERTA